ncbi:helix-turn-helix domain-containing protein [Pusillimonas sp. CC-YST705]|uniref:Helix-turn-helix domain-containing protein n=1 Tax=Mesopusillimonas faecipullorum TaxID=2755040 RepID=A0ABS8C9U5_9BURK|nr:helix-turn-helix domain-containing protein [Mesopusillimonas faecipullorum]MCB5362394.1 helix-turn-helix domain-containing protein [Mesopusillimonas faecipullorum]
MALMLLTPQQNRELSLNSDRKSVFSAPIGTMEIVPANAELYAQWKETKECLLVALSPHKLSQLAGLEFEREDFEFHPTDCGHVDQQALMLAHLIRKEFQDCNLLNHLYLDSLLTVYSTHLLRNYSTFRDRSSPRPRGGLSPKTRRSVEDYIRTHIGDNLSVSQLAQIAELSPSHFLRAFKQTIGQAPYQYVLAIRLEQAEKLVVSTDMELAEIAKITGFSSHSHMTSLMRRNKLTTPSSLRRIRITR